VAKLKFRDIMGYCVIIFLVYAVITSIAFWLGPIIGI
jgi:short subunit fatty acids transporter